MTPARSGRSRRSLRSGDALRSLLTLLTNRSNGSRRSGLAGNTVTSGSSWSALGSILSGVARRSNRSRGTARSCEGAVFISCEITKKTSRSRSSRNNSNNNNSKQQQHGYQQIRTSTGIDAKKKNNYRTLAFVGLAEPALGVLSLAVLSVVRGRDLDDPLPGLGADAAALVAVVGRDVSNVGVGVGNGGGVPPPPGPGVPAPVADGPGRPGPPVAVERAGLLVARVDLQGGAVAAVAVRVGQQELESVAAAAGARGLDEALGRGNCALRVRMRGRVRVGGCQNSERKRHELLFYTFQQKSF